MSAIFSRHELNRSAFRRRNLDEEFSQQVGIRAKHSATPDTHKGNAIDISFLDQFLHLFAILDFLVMGGLALVTFLEKEIDNIRTLVLRISVENAASKSRDPTEHFVQII